MMKAEQLRELIIKPTLRYLEPEIPYSEAAAELLMMTCAHESHLGTYIAQIKGPALGIYQMEPKTEYDVHTNFLAYREDLEDKVNYLDAPTEIETSSLVTNLAYATAMARVHYYRVREALPDVEDKRGLAEYAKSYYNTDAGKATWMDYLKSYNERCL